MARFFTFFSLNLFFYNLLAFILAYSRPPEVVVPVCGGRFSCRNRKTKVTSPRHRKHKENSSEKLHSILAVVRAARGNSKSRKKHTEMRQ
uniref:Putative secreted protein n=1 Tax=Anopheles darlingi TaxID=43151 RepID=A0A2M4DPU1_ANODA